MNDHIEIEVGYFESAACDLNAFTALIDQTADPSTVPHAEDIQKNVPIYEHVQIAPVA